MPRTSLNAGHYHVYVLGENFTKPGGEDDHVHQVTTANRQKEMTGAALNKNTLLQVDSHKHFIKSFADEVIAEQKQREADLEAKKAKEKRKRLDEGLFLPNDNETTYRKVDPKDNG